MLQWTEDEQRRQVKKMCKFNAYMYPQIGSYKDTIRWTEADGDIVRVRSQEVTVRVFRAVKSPEHVQFIKPNYTFTVDSTH